MIGAFKSYGAVTALTLRCSLLLRRLPSAITTASAGATGRVGVSQWVVPRANLSTAGYQPHPPSHTRSQSQSQSGRPAPGRSQSDRPQSQSQSVRTKPPPRVQNTGTRSGGSVPPIRSPPPNPNAANDLIDQYLRLQPSKRTEKQIAALIDMIWAIAKTPLFTAADAHDRLAAMNRIVKTLSSTSIQSQRLSAGSRIRLDRQLVWAVCEVGRKFSAFGGSYAVNALRLVCNELLKPHAIRVAESISGKALISFEILMQMNGVAIPNESCKCCSAVLLLTLPITCRFDSSSSVVHCVARGVLSVIQ